MVSVVEISIVNVTTKLELYLGTSSETVNQSASNELTCYIRPIERFIVIILIDGKQAIL